jgi:hypothetical protein
LLLPVLRMLDKIGKIEDVLNRQGVRCDYGNPF